MIIAFSAISIAASALLPIFFQYMLYEGVDHGYYYADFPVTGNSENFTFSLSKLCRNCRGYCNFINKDTFKITKDHVHFVDMNKPSGNHTSGQVHIMSLPSGEDVHTASYQNNTSTNQIIRVLDFWSGEYLGNTNSNGGLVLTGTVPEDAATNCVMSVELSPGETYIVPDITEGGGFVFNVAVPNFSANDNDGDGFNDGYEFEHGSDWNDPDSVPVTMQGTNFFSSAAGLLISTPLSASTGVPPYKWKVDRGKLPSGLKLNGNAIQGAPQIEGRYAFRLRLSDMAGTFQLIDCVYEVTPGREKTLKKFGPARFVPQSE